MTGLLLRVSIGDVDHLDALRGEGAAFAGVLDRADAGLPVPACGEWRLRELAPTTSAGCTAGRQPRRDDALAD